METTEDFSKLLIKECKRWSIYANHNQGYFGRCVVWRKHENALDLADATSEEQVELFGFACFKRSRQTSFSARLV